jgi:hypothetical protein
MRRQVCGPRAGCREAAAGYCGVACPVAHRCNPSNAQGWAR